MTTITDASYFIVSSRKRIARSCFFRGGEDCVAEQSCLWGALYSREILAECQVGCLNGAFFLFPEVVCIVDKVGGYTVLMLVFLLLLGL